MKGRNNPIVGINVAIIRFCKADLFKLYVSLCSLCSVLCCVNAVVKAWLG